MTAVAKPAVSYLNLAEDGRHRLEGSRCDQCGAMFLGQREVCPACSGRGCLSPMRLSDRGRVYSFTTIHRSFPGIPVPFVMAVVDLENGPSVRGNIVGVDHTKVYFDMPVKLTYFDSQQKDTAGNPYIAFAFIPDQGA